MTGRLHRRQLLVASAAAAASSLLARRSGAVEPPLPLLPFRVVVADVTPVGGGAARPAVAPAFVDAQLAKTATLFAPHGISFAEAAIPRAAIAASHGRLETRGDRDALAAHLVGGVIELFFVGSLRDVDDPSGFRMGVTWRKLTDLKKKYVIVAADAGPTTLAHELGHYLGNGHSSVRNNLMSYDRDGGEVTLDAAQGRVGRRTARALIARRELVVPG